MQGHLPDDRFTLAFDRRPCQRTHNSARRFALYTNHFRAATVDAWTFDKDGSG